MPLITRQGKGSKLTIQEMDGNLTYLESLAQSGLAGSNYVYVAADGTPSENAAELQAAYDLAKTKVTSIATPTSDFITALGGSPRSLDTNNFWGYGVLPIVPNGAMQAQIISGSGSETIDIVVTQSNSFFIIFSSSVVRTNVTSFVILAPEFLRVSVIMSPGYYDFSSDFVVNDANVDLISLDGNASVVFNGNGTIDVTADSVFIKGVNVQSKNFKIGDNLSNIKVENCIGGNYSFGGDETEGSNPLIVSGTFINCKGGRYCFGSYGGTASGTFIDCIASDGYSFGHLGVASGTFKNCGDSTGCFGGEGGVASGTFENCKCLSSSFGGSAFPITGGAASGTFINCETGQSSFGSQGEASGTFVNCVAIDSSFGYGQYGTLTGKLFYCRLTNGTFPTVSSGGRTYYCVDGNGNTNNQ